MQVLNMIEVEQYYIFVYIHFCILSILTMYLVLSTL